MVYPFIRESPKEAPEHIWLLTTNTTAFLHGSSCIEEVTVHEWGQNGIIATDGGDTDYWLLPINIILI